MKVMFVCTGNTCRSPIAEYIFRDECKKRGIDVEVLSSGVSTYDGRLISENSRLALEKLNIFGSEEHRSRQFSGQLAGECDLIFTMTRAHKAYIPIDIPNMYSIAEYTGLGDISDPYGMSEEVYYNCALKIKESVLKIIEIIQKDNLLPIRRDKQMTDYMTNYKKWLDLGSSMAKADYDRLVEIGKDEKAIKEAFSIPLSFGTAGMRGIIDIGMNRMNEYTVARATLGLSRFIKHRGGENEGVLIGYDTRIKSYEFAVTTARVLENNGIKVYLYEDVRPVPMVSFGVRELGCFAGVMITASHNPKEYNGYKVYGQDGAQLDLDASDELTAEISKIEDYVGISESSTDLSESKVRGLDGIQLSDKITIMGKGLDSRFFSAIDALRLSPDAPQKAKGKIKIVYTPLHGAGYYPVTATFERMGVDYITVKEQCEKDGNFPTVITPNPESAEALTMAIKLAESEGAGAVIATDPDSDRMGIALRDKDGKMQVLTGNQIGVIMLDYVLERRKETGKFPKNSAFIKSIVTTALARKVAEGAGCESIDVLTGFKFFGEKIKLWESTGEFEYLFGFEESFGYLCGTHARDKDAVSASMTFAEMLCYYAQIGVTAFERLEAIYKKYGYYKDLSGSVTYKGLDGMAKMSAIMDEIRANAPKTLGGIKVEYVSDFTKGTRVYVDGRVEKLPQAKTNVIFFGLGDTDWACVRPSGTEPKLKYYISIGEPTMEGAEKKANAILKDVKALIE